jgi:hypothetical protein
LLSFPAPLSGLWPIKVRTTCSSTGRAEGLGYDTLNYVQPDKITQTY